MRPKKSLGQNFLTSKHALASIISAGDIEPTDTVLEIGPGKGALTATLLQKAGTVIAVEKDDLLIPYLEDIFAHEITSGKLKLVHGDILELSPQELLLPEEYKIIANIPYYITGALLRTFLESERQPQRMVLMLQKEVAKRIVARDEKESLLSLSIKAYGTPKYIDTVKAIHFSPRPNVDSAILLIENISKQFFGTGLSESKYFEVLKAGFAHKRKLLSRNLESSFEKEKIAAAFEVCRIDKNTRAEDVPLETWKCLATHLQA